MSGLIMLEVWGLNKFLGKTSVHILLVPTENCGKT